MEYTPVDLGNSQTDATTAEPTRDKKDQNSIPDKVLFGNEKADASYGAIMAMLSSPQYLALVGFIVIAAMGHLADWKAWALYVSFIVVTSLYTAFKIFLNRTIDIFRAGIGWRSLKPLLTFFVLGMICTLITLVIFPLVSLNLHEQASSVLRRLFPSEEAKTDAQHVDPEV